MSVFNRYNYEDNGVYAPKSQKPCAAPEHNLKGVELKKESQSMGMLPIGVIVLAFCFLVVNSFRTVEPEIKVQQMGSITPLQSPRVGQGIIEAVVTSNDGIEYGEDELIPAQVKVVTASVQVDRKPKKKEKNESAPSWVTDKASINYYLNQYSKLAVDGMKRTGILASVTLAQALVESNCGRSKIAVKNKNHFGRKCFSKKHNGCCRKFKDDNNGDSFREFTTVAESYKSHEANLKESRYKNLFTFGKDYRKWCNELQRVGYATDKQYAAKLIDCIERNNLTRFDR